MDPLTQGVLGAVMPQAVAARSERTVVIAGFCGFAAGLAADLDVLITSATDPLLVLEYHRQFSHSLLFIPVGGLAVAALLHIVFGRWMRLPFGRMLLICTLGYGTHGLLDFATSYGTMLFWPFSEERFAASIVSVVDPMLTLPVTALALVACIRRSPLWARLALVWLCLYLIAASVQRHGALGMAEALAASRGHAVQRLTVKPTFGNILVWRSVYEAQERFFVDGLRVGIGEKIYPGTSVARLDPARDFSWLDPASQQNRDLERFGRFSQGYVARNPADANSVIDVRYSVLPTELSALWSIALTPGVALDQHVRFNTDRSGARADAAKLWRMITTTTE